MEREELLHPVHVKRTNLVLDEQVLEEAKRLSGKKTTPPP
jgi:hypothetical protein